MRKMKLEEEGARERERWRRVVGEAIKNWVRIAMTVSKQVTYMHTSIKAGFA